ncbi:kinase-like protein [Roridomyces roridus]|uniref:non-specific serine/threonine protein kinase n=1 Tax=Roridomyces roridus TaxID=1738132 RepID=A0AAD7AXY2_9AGAR|nr:kinase-like protein [Roridomyces roridus]
MSEEGESSPRRALIPIFPVVQNWRPILHASNQVVLYNPTSHALSIRQSSPSNLPSPTRVQPPCPYCKRPLPDDFLADSAAAELEDEDPDTDVDASFRASNYFHLLQISNEISSRPSTPPPIGDSRTFPVEAMAEGYFKAFFQEEERLGMGANGTVYLCQHVLDGNPLGHFAVKKIAVGESHSYLLNILKEVRLLEQLHHPNIITYHHAWLESCQFSSFGPKIPTLHVLMQWAEAGSLDDFIDVRLGRRSPSIHVHAADQSASDPQTPNGDTPAADHEREQLSRSARIRAFREFQRAPPERQEQMRRTQMARSRSGNGDSPQTWTAVHLLSAEEVQSLFRDVVEGLAFLHDKSILHLDLKPGNVLLTWDGGRLIPRAMLSDFGTSRDMLQSSRSRSGNTGTLEYTAPESLPSPRTGFLLQPVDSKADMWSLGMILHKLLFFKLPYEFASDSTECGSKVGEGDKMERLEREVLEYAGFKSNQTLAMQFEARRLPRAFLVLLEGLLNLVPAGRPSCERVATAIREGRLDPMLARQRQPQATSNNSLITVPRRPSDPGDASALDSAAVVAVDSTQERPQEEQREEDEHPHESDLGVDMDETKPLLSLGPPPLPPTTTQHTNHNRWEMLVQRVPLVPPPMVLGVRTTKSCIMIAKILSIYSPGCAQSRVAISLLLVLAVVDTWFDGLWITVLLAGVHWGILRFGCWGHACCT